MELSLSGDDLGILVRALEHTIQETATEARRSDSMTYRHRLRWEKQRLLAILGQLQEGEQLVAQSEQSFDLQEPEFDFGEEQGSTGYMVSALMGPR
jgi:hypothetical protein